MNDTKKLVLLLIGSVALVAFAFWMITPLRSEGDLLSAIFGGGSTVIPGANVKVNELEIDLSKQYTAEIITSEGAFVVELFATNAPFTVSNFVGLSNSNFYDGSSFYRIVPGFIVQAGRNALGASSKEIVMDEINAESLGLEDITVGDATFLTTVYNENDKSTYAFSPGNLSKYRNYTVKKFYQSELGYLYRTDVTSVRAERWTVGMANSGPNTATSEFFIVTAPLPQGHIDGRYTIFGRVTSGFDVVLKIEANPADQISISDVRITER